MADITPAQLRYLEALEGAGDRSMMCAQLARIVHAGNFKMTQYRPHLRGVNQGGAAGGLGNLAAGRMMYRLWTVGLVSRDRRYAYTLTAAGRKAIADARAAAAARAAEEAPAP
jgi:hypothetical protein